MTDNIKLTDDRIRFYLQTDQYKQETLCASLLARQEGFKSVMNRQPGGGSDGGCDINCRFQGRSAICGVGFANNACDSPEQRKDKIAKFKSDLAVALKLDRHLSTFIFITNVYLTYQQKQALEKHALKKGLDTVLIVDRPNLVRWLNEPKAFSIRHHFLDIEMNPVEQKAFFSEWGDTINSKIVETFAGVDDALSRIRFVQDASVVLSDITVVLHPHEPFVDDDYFACVVITGPHMPEECREIYFSVEGIKIGKGKYHGVLTTKTIPSELDSMSQRLPEEDDSLIRFAFFNSGFVSRHCRLRLIDLNEANICIRSSRNLLGKIKAVTVYSGAYKLAYFDRVSNLDFETNPDVVTGNVAFETSDFELSREIAVKAPIGLICQSPCLRFHFNHTTPARDDDRDFSRTISEGKYDIEPWEIYRMSNPELFPCG